MFSYGHLHIHDYLVRRAIIHLQNIEQEILYT